MEGKLLKLDTDKEVSMICPGCGSTNEIAYSVISHGLICLSPNCGWEIEMSPVEAADLLGRPVVCEEFVLV